MSSTDRIEKFTVLNAPLERVWNAISDSESFGTWFGMRVDGPFVEGSTVSGVIAVTEVDDEVAERQRPYAGEPVTLDIVAVEPQRRFAFRWNPLPGSDLTTLVEFTLTDTADGVQFRVVESGFEALPAEHRRSIFDGNSEGWALQMRLIAAFLAQPVQR